MKGAQCSGPDSTRILPSEITTEIEVVPMHYSKGRNRGFELGLFLGYVTIGCEEEHCCPSEYTIAAIR